MVRPEEPSLWQLVDLLTWLAEDDFFDYFVAEGFVDAGDEGGAGEHELVAQRGAADGECEHTVFHRAVGGVAVHALTHECGPHSQSALFVEADIQSLLTQHLVDNISN